MIVILAHAMTRVCINPTHIPRIVTNDAMFDHHISSNEWSRQGIHTYMLKMKCFVQFAEDRNEPIDLERG